MMSDWIPGEVYFCYGETIGEHAHDVHQARRSYDRTTATNDKAHDVIATLTADLARVTAERDAILRWASGHAGHIGPGVDDGSGRFWAMKGSETIFGDTAEEVVRKAAGLDPEGGPDCTPDPTS
jgi:hypothetical protein